MDKSVFRPIQSQPIPTGNIRSAKSKELSSNSFAMQFQQAIGANDKLIISKHAKARLQQRDIHISDRSWDQIQQKVNEAKKLGVKDSLVLLDNAALIVSAKNNTVITVMDSHEAKSQIFTNINGTIVI